MKDGMNIQIETNVLIRDETNDKVLVDKSNAIHPQNMSRILARALSNEPNSTIYRMAFGNGGTFKDVGDTLVLNPPNDGTIDGWESRLYNETYSEVVDESNVDLGIDLGSAGPNVIRTGGGSDPSSDPIGSGVVSQEAGIKSNVIITVFLNENEPRGQDLTILNPSGGEDFIFDEIGLYSPGLPAAASSGYTSIFVNNKTSTDPSSVQPNDILNIELNVDGNDYSATLTVPASGTGPTGQITYGDICQGINSGDWVTGGDAIQDYVYVFITDDSGGTYDTIIGKQSYGLLTFQSRGTPGNDSGVVIACDDTDPNNFANVVTQGICSNCNVSNIEGSDAGVANDTINSDNERERLLTHIIFNPIPKANDVAISIKYTLTISVCTTSDAEVSVL